MAREVPVSEWYVDPLHRDESGNPVEYAVIPEVYDTPELVDQRAAEIFAKQVIEKPDSIISLATGSSPLGMYQRLVEMAERREVDFSRMTAFQLDEYVGLHPDHPQSYNRYVRENFLDRVGVPEKNRQLIDGSYDPYAMAYIYQYLLDRVGHPDFNILGLGPKLTCHVAFNEQGSKLYSRVRVVALSEDTIQANARFFEDPSLVPTHAITQGVEDLLKAKKLLMVVKGKEKAEGVLRMLYGDIGPEAPASYLRYHPDFTVLLDRDAATLLPSRS